MTNGEMKHGALDLHHRERQVDISKHMIASHMRHLWANSLFEVARRKKTRNLVNKWRIRDVTVYYDIPIGLKLSVMRIYNCTYFHFSVPHVTFAREYNRLDLNLYHSNCRGVYLPTNVYMMGSNSLNAQNLRINHVQVTREVIKRSGRCFMYYPMALLRLPFVLRMPSSANRGHQTSSRSRRGLERLHCHLSLDRCTSTWRNTTR